MRAVVQRVKKARVIVDGKTVGEIEKGLMVLIGFDDSDDSKSMAYIMDKLMNLRIFEDSEEKMNLSVQDLEGGILIVPNFTLYGDARKGRRPSFINGASPEKASQMYGDFIKLANESYGKVETGIFQAHMEVEIINDGPVTILLDSSKLF